jgi:quinol monooxygenase YgiN
MEKKANIEGKILAVAAYKPKPGQEEALMKLVEKHLPKLRELELATARENYIARSQDGTILEVFEWESIDAVHAAHQHPAISDIWEKMTLVADFFPINQLSECRGPFADFKILK